MSAELAASMAWWGSPGLLALVLLGGWSVSRPVRVERVGHETVARWRRRLRLLSRLLLAALVALLLWSLHATEPGDLTLLKIFGPYFLLLVGGGMIEFWLGKANPHVQKSRAPGSADREAAISAVAEPFGSGPAPYHCTDRDGGERGSGPFDSGGGGGSFAVGGD